MRPVTDLKRRVAPFEVVSEYQPCGDQPAAIKDVERRITGGEQDVVLLGATAPARPRPSPGPSSICNARPW